MRPNPDIINERYRRAMTAVAREIKYANGGLYDQQRVLWDMNDGKHPYETYEQVLEAVEEAEEKLGVHDV